MRKYKIQLLLVIICFLLSSCWKESVENTEMLKYVDNSTGSSREFFEDNDATELFQELYGVVNLIEHKTYSVDDELCFEYKFSSSILPNEVAGIHSYYSKMAFDRKIIGRIPYGNTINLLNAFNKITLRIFVEDDLLQYKSFEFPSKVSSYYENMHTEVDRKYNGVNYDNYVSRIKKISTDIKEIEILKPYKGYVVYFRIDCSTKLDDEKLQEVMKVVELEIAPDLEKLAFELYGMNTNSLGIVLAIEDGKTVSEELIYFNGDDKKWVDIEWQTFDFFHENTQ